MLYLNRRPEIRKFPLKSRKKSDKRAGYRYHYLISDQMIKNMHFTPSSVFCVPKVKIATVQAQWQFLLLALTSFHYLLEKLTHNSVYHASLGLSSYHWHKLFHNLSFVLTFRCINPKLIKNLFDQLFNGILT